MSLFAMTTLWREAEVKGGELLVLLALADEADESGYTFFRRAPSFIHIAQKARLGRSQVIRIIKRLEAHGEIEVDRGERENRYVLCRVREAYAARSEADREREANKTGGGSKKTPGPKPETGVVAPALPGGSASATRVVAPARPGGSASATRVVAPALPAIDGPDGTRQQHDGGGDGLAAARAARSAEGKKKQKPEAPDLAAFPLGSRWRNVACGVEARSR